MKAPNSDDPEESSNGRNDGRPDDVWNDAPEFLDSNDVVEIATLEADDEMPMEDDDDDALDDEEEEVEEPIDADTDEPPSPELFQVLSAHSGPVYSCALASLTASSCIIVSGGGDDAAYWTPVENGNLHALATTATTASPPPNSKKLSYAHSDSVCAVAFGRHAQQPLLLAVGGYDGIILLYDGTTGDCLMNISTSQEEYKNSFVGPTDVEWLTFHKSGTVLLAGSATDGTVWMYHVVVPSSSSSSYYSLQCMQVLVGHASMVAAGGFTADGRWAVTIGNSGTRDDATCRVWNPKTGVAKHTIHLHAGSLTGTLPPLSAAQEDEAAANGVAGLTCLALGLVDDALSAATLTANQNNTGATGTTSTTNANSSHSKLVLVGSEDGWAYVCHVGTGKVVHALRHAANVPLVTPMDHHSSSMEVEEEDDTMTPQLSIEAVGFCPANPLWCATGGADGVLKIWDLGNGQCRHLCRVSDALSDNHSTATAGITRLCWLPPVQSLTTGTVTTPAPPIVLVATTDGRIHVWDARNGALLQTLRTGGRATINDLQVITIQEHFSIVATASEDHAVRLFHLNVLELLQPKPPSL